MRHGKKINSLSRKSEHRKAMLSNLASSLIVHKRIKTTVAKAKALRKYIEPLITRSKYDNTHSRRTVFKYIGDKEAVKELFITVADKIADRPGGYTRIIKLGNRFGDNAEMALIELVDFNENLLEEKAKSGSRKRRRRRGGGKAKSATGTTESGYGGSEGSKEATQDSTEDDKSSESEGNKNHEGEENQNESGDKSDERDDKKE